MCELACFRYFLLIGITLLMINTDGTEAQAVECKYSTSRTVTCNTNADCVDGAEADTKICKCKAGFDGDGEQCTKICTDCLDTDNKECLNGECKCKADFSPNPAGKMTATTKCEKTCDPASCTGNKHCVTHLCKCKDAFTEKVEGESTTCMETCTVTNCPAADNKHCDKGQCKCNDTFGKTGTGDNMKCVKKCRDDSKCQPDAKCIKEPADAEEGTCKCNDGFVAEGAKCSKKVPTKSAGGAKQSVWIVVGSIIIASVAGVGY